MAFTWILGKRRDYAGPTVEDEAPPSAQPASGQPVEEGSNDQDGAIKLADIMLSIEDGLLMAYGPHGDPVPPELLIRSCALEPAGEIRLPNGVAVDHKRLKQVLLAQQTGPLADRPNDPWLKVMLGAGGTFEDVSSDALEDEERQGKCVLASRLTLDMPGGDIITLADAHPGSARCRSPIRLVVDGKPMSIEGAFCRAVSDKSGSRSQSTSEPVLAHRGDAVALLLGKEVEARLETASVVWDGEPKVDLFLKDGRPISIDDLAAAFKDISPSCGASATSYPLLGRDEPAFNRERATLATVADMPEGWSLTAGLKSEDGSWMLDPSDLDRTLVLVAGDHAGPNTLTINVISIVGHDGTLEKQSRAVVIPPADSKDGALPASSPSASEPDEQTSSDIALAFDDAVTCLAVLADALLVRGIPDGASLSAGIFDPVVKGWILRPASLSQLVIRDLDHEAGAVEIVLTAVSLDKEGHSRADVIARKTITVGGSSRSFDAHQSRAGLC